MAILKGNTGAVAVDLISRDLKLMKDRVEHIGIILNLALIIKALPEPGVHRRIPINSR